MNQLALVRPYLTIIADSFRAALASRVLWAAMLAIWLLLVALAPIGSREDYTTSFRWFDFYNGTRMKALLAQGLVDPDEADTPLGRLARAMPEDLRRQLNRVGEGEEVRIPLSTLTDALNDLIEQDASLSQQDEPPAKDDAWYDAEAWQETVRLRELRELDAADGSELSDSLRRRRARLRIEAALPGVFEARSARSVLLTYAGLEFPTGFEIDRNQFRIIFNQFVIPTLAHWLLGLVLVFLGVLVTASIIPEMLRPGSLHLLLSKPISRTGLLLSKFIGGCAFVFLCVAQLVVGLYLIAGWRLDIWNPRILWCVPVSLVMFAVFFSVSVPAGLKWRSSIISIAAAGGLAAICFLVGIVDGVFQARVVQPSRIRSLAVVGEDWFAVTEGSGLVRYDHDQNQWMEVIESEVMSRDRVLDPVALNSDTLLTARVRNGRLNPFGSGALDLLALHRQQNWTPTPTLRLPTGTERLTVLPDRSVLAVNSADISLADGQQVVQLLGENRSTDDAEAPTTDSTQETDTAESNGREKNAAGQKGSVGSVNRIGNWLQTLVTMQGGATADFSSILPRDVLLTPPTRIVPVVEISGENQTVEHLLLMSGDRIQRLTRPANSYAGKNPSETQRVWSTTATTEVSADDTNDPVFLAATGELMISGRGDGQMNMHSTSDLKQLGAVSLPDDLTPLNVIALSADGSDQENLFAIQTVEGEVRTLSVTTARQGPGDSIAKASADRVAKVAESSSQDERRDDAERLPIARWSRPLPVGNVEAIFFDRRTNQLLVAHEIDRLAVADFSANSTSGAFDAEGKNVAENEQVAAADLRMSEPDLRFYRPSLSYWRTIYRYGVGSIRFLTPRVLELGELATVMVSGEESLVVDQSETGSGDVVQYQTIGPLASCLSFIAVMLFISCVAFARQDF